MKTSVLRFAIPAFLFAFCGEVHAAKLESMDIFSESGHVKIVLKSDRPIVHRAQWLPQTGRVLLVLDFPGLDVAGFRPKNPYPAPVLHIGLSQWRKQPLVGRLAIHLKDRRSWSIDTANNEAIITILDEAPPSPSQASQPVAAAIRGRIRSVAAATLLDNSHPGKVPTAPAMSLPVTAATVPEKNTRVTLLFRDAELSNVLRVIGEQNHLNLILPPEIHGTVTVFMENVPVEEALRKILFVHGYGHVMQDGVLLVVPGVNDQGNYTIYRPAATSAQSLYRTLEKLIPAPGKLFFDDASNSIILYAPQPGIKPVFESIYSGLASADRHVVGTDRHDAGSPSAPSGN